MIRSPGDVTTTDTATTGSTHEIRTGTARTAIDLLLVAVLGAVFLRVAVWPTFVHHYPFGVGPDMPVYLWWSRVGAAEGNAKGTGTRKEFDLDRNSFASGLKWYNLHRVLLLSVC